VGAYSNSEVQMSNSFNKTEKQKFREQLQKDIIDFLNSGGKIEVCTSDDNAGANVQLRPSKYRKGIVYTNNTYSRNQKQMIDKKMFKRILVK
jgi:hypothetical protein